MLTILSVGEDPHLLQTRTELLRKTGANVLSSTGETAARYIAEWEFDVIVMCHSVWKDDAEKIPRIARARSAKTRILMLSPDRPTTFESADAVLDGMAFDPGELLRRVSDLLKEASAGVRTNTMRSDSGAFPISSAGKVDPGKKKPSNYPAETAARKSQDYSL